MKNGAAALIIAAVLGLTAPDDVAAQRPGGGLVIQAPAEPPGLDLTASPASAIAVVVHYNIQECLVKIDKTGKLVPWLAERWHTTDHLNYTFFLKKGVKFHNGRALAASDMKFVLERALNPETKHPHRSHYEPIASIHVRDEYTITISLKQANASFLLNLARQGSVIYPRGAVETLKSHPVGTGPFLFSEWVRGDRIGLTKNPDYHVKGLGTQPPHPAWGLMLKEAQSFLSLSPWFAIFPGGAIALTVLGLNLLGDGLRDLLDPRLRHS